jgi:hypothetical protein
MESNKDFLVFEVIADDILLPETIKTYNEIYKTDFEIINISYEEVIWIKIRVKNDKLMDIFQLGMQYGGFIEIKRAKGEIDW